MRRGNRSTRAGVLVALVAMLSLSISACGAGYSAPQPSISTSTTRPPSLVEAAGDRGSTGGRAPNTSAVPPADPTDAIVPMPDQPAPEETPQTTAAPTTLVDREALEDQLPDVGFVQACVAATGAYAVMHALALQGTSGAAEATETAAGIKGILPPSLHDEVDTVAAAIASAATDGSFEPKPATKPGYVPANAALSSFFDGGCLG